MRATELSFLLELSRGLAAVPDRPVLLQILHELAQPEFSFQSLNLFGYTTDGQQLLDWATEQPGALGLSGPRLAYPAAGFAGLFDYLARTDGPTVMPYDAAYFRLLGNTTLCTDTRRIVRAGDYRECLGTLLQAGGRVIGYLAFNASKQGAFQSAHLEVFEALAEQVAGAVANILAHEEIWRREAEKAMLLGVSQVIATVRDKQDQLRLLVDVIRPALGIYDCCLFVVDPDGQHHTDWTVLLPEMDPSDGNVALHAAGLGRHPHPGSVIAANMQRAAEGAFIVDFQQEFELHPTYPFLSFILEGEG